MYFSQELLFKFTLFTYLKRDQCLLAQLAPFPVSACLYDKYVANINASFLLTFTDEINDRKTKQIKLVPIFSDKYSRNVNFGKNRSIDACGTLTQKKKWKNTFARSWRVISNNTFFYQDQSTENEPQLSLNFLEIKAQLSLNFIGP